MMVSKGYSTVSHGQIHYRMTAERGKRPLLFLHQTPSSSATYEALMTKLAADFWCIAPDTPGFGQSDQLANGATIAGYATAVCQFLHASNIQNCAVFGHHTGASIAVQLAFDHPERVTKLAISGPPLLTGAQIAHLKTTLPSMELDADGSFLTDLWQRLRHKNPNLSLDITLRETIAALQCRDSYHAAYHAVFAQDFAGQLAALTCPVLLMAGEQDSLFASLQPAADLVRNGRMHIIPDADTYICDQHPQTVAKLLRNFFLE